MELKPIIFVSGTLIKFAVIIFGLGLTFWFLIKGLNENNSIKKKKALKYFLLTILVVSILTIIEFTLTYII